MKVLYENLGIFSSAESDKIVE